MSIETTVNEVARRHGVNGHAAVTEVVRALTERDYQIRDTITRAAQSAGVREADVRSILDDLGIAARPVVAAATSGTGAALNPVLARELQSLRGQYPALAEAVSGLLSR